MRLAQREDASWIRLGPCLHWQHVDCCRACQYSQTCHESQGTGISVRCRMYSLQAGFNTGKIHIFGRIWNVIRYTGLGVFGRRFASQMNGDFVRYGTAVGFFIPRRHLGRFVHTSSLWTVKFPQIILSLFRSYRHFTVLTYSRTRIYRMPA